MSVRPIRPRRPPRRPSRVRDLPIVVCIATILLAFWLRAIMAALNVQDWLAAWKLVNAFTRPIIALLQVVPVLDTAIVNRLTLADVVAVILMTTGSMFGLASLSIRRAP